MYIYIYVYIHVYIYIRTCAQTPVKTDMHGSENCLTTPCNEQEVSIARVLALWNHHSPMYSHRFALHAFRRLELDFLGSRDGQATQAPTNIQSLSLCPCIYDTYTSYIYVYMKISAYIDTS